MEALAGCPLGRQLITIVEDKGVSRAEIDQLRRGVEETQCEHGLVVVHEAARSLLANQQLFEPGAYVYFQESWAAPNGMHTMLRQKILSNLHRMFREDREVNSYLLPVGISALLVGLVCYGLYCWRFSEKHWLGGGVAFSSLLIGAAATICGIMASFKPKDFDGYLASHRDQGKLPREVTDP